MAFRRRLNDRSTLIVDFDSPIRASVVDDLPSGVESSTDTTTTKGLNLSDVS